MLDFNFSDIRFQAIKDEAWAYSHRNHEMAVGIANYIRGNGNGDMTLQEYYEDNLICMAFADGVKFAQQQIATQQATQQAKQPQGFFRKVCSRFSGSPNKAT